MQMKQLTLAAGLVIGSVGIAAAAPAYVTGDLNLRSGPGTNYRVLDVLPGGATVNVLGCDGAWCRVAWGGGVGFASSSYLGFGRPAYAAAPPLYVRPPSIGFGFGWGNGWNNGGRHHGRHHWRRHH